MNFAFIRYDYVSSSGVEMLYGFSTPLELTDNSNIIGKLNFIKKSLKAINFYKDNRLKWY